MKKLHEMTLSELSNWAGSDPVRRKVCDARTFAGNGSPEERAIRLMVWTGATLRSGPKHSRLRDPLDILREGSAWCDQHAKILTFLMWVLFQVDGRQIALYHNDGNNGHSVAELILEGSWRLFDAHSDHQAIYRHPKLGHIMGHAEIRQHPQVVVAEGHWWKGNNGVGKEGFYLTNPDKTYFDSKVSLLNQYNTPTDWNT